MRAALTDRKFLNGGSAGQAGFAFAVVNVKIILKLTAAIDPVYAGAVATDTFS